MHEESIELSSGGFQTLRTCGTLCLLQCNCQPLVRSLKLFVFEAQLAALDAPSKVVQWKQRQAELGQIQATEVTLSSSS